LIPEEHHKSWHGTIIGDLHVRDNVNETSQREKRERERGEEMGEERSGEERRGAEEERRREERREEGGEEWRAEERTGQERIGERTCASVHATVQITNTRHIVMQKFSIAYTEPEGLPVRI